MNTNKYRNLVIGKIVIVALMFSNNAFSQGMSASAVTSDEVKAEINKQIWEEFTTSYHEVDFSKFKSIHSENMTRVTIDSKKVQNYESYMADMGGFFNMIKNRGDTLGIRFSFTERLESGGLAFESGYYEFSMKRKGGSEFSVMGYGQFDVVLKKEGGIWKIQYDRDKAVRITNEEFESNEVVSLNK